MPETDVVLQAEAVCENPCTFSAQVEGAAFVAYTADDWVIGQSADIDADYAITYDFQQRGVRTIRATAYDRHGRRIGDDTQQITVFETGLSLDVADACETPCTFKVNASRDIVAVRYFAETWALGESNDAKNGFALDYDFYTLGRRQIVAVGLNAAGEEVASDEAMVDVFEQSTLPDVPYFYQLANAVNPSGSCQNTSIAMLLSYYGVRIEPDTISNAWGTSVAQSPAGLAKVFNDYASTRGIPQRLRPTTNGTIAGLQAELDAGRPVIVHGYFTSYGHIMVVLGYDKDGYWVNDPAGEWIQSFAGGYYKGWQPNIGQGIYYQKAVFEQAIATSDGVQDLPLWYHRVR